MNGDAVNEDGGVGVLGGVGDGGGRDGHGRRSRSTHGSGVGGGGIAAGSRRRTEGTAGACWSATPVDTGVGGIIGDVGFERSLRAAVQGCRWDTRGKGNRDGLRSGAATAGGTPAATAAAATTSVKKKDKGYEQGSEFPVHRISVQIQKD